MSQPTDFDTLLSDWLADDGPSDVPARVAQGAIAQVRALSPVQAGATTVVRPLVRPWRPIRVLAAAAALVALALVAALAIGALRPSPPPLPAVVEGLPSNGLIAISRHWDLVLIDPVTGSESKVPAEWAVDLDVDPDFSPDGQWVTWWSHGWDDSVDRLRMSSMDPQDEAPRETELGGPTGMSDWSPGSDRIAAGAGRDDGTWALRILDTRLQETDRFDGITVGGIAWRPDGGALLLQTMDDDKTLALQTLSYPDGALTMLSEQDPSDLFDAFTGAYAYAQFSPDASLIVYQMPTVPREDGSFDHRVVVMHADGSDPRQLVWSAEADWEEPIGWSADGRWLLVRSTSDAGTDLVLLPADGSAGRLLTHLEGRQWSPVWSPDQTLIAAWQSKTGDVMLIDVATGAQTPKDWEATGGLSWQPIPATSAE